MTLTDARAGHEAVKSRLISERRGAKEYWSATNAPDREQYDTSGPYLLPGFDEYLLGYKDRGDVLAAEHAGKVVPGGNGIFFPIIVVNGQVVGTWKRTFKKGSVAVALSPFTRLDVSKPSFASAAQRFSDYLGLPLFPPEIAL